MLCGIRRLAPQFAEKTQIVPGLCNVRIQFERLVLVRQSPGKVPTFPKRVSQLLVDACAMGSELDCTPGCRKGLAVLSRAGKRVRQL